MTRHLICTLVGLVALIGLLVIVPKQHFSPHGIVLPEKVVRAPISPKDVTLYHQIPLNEKQVLGHIRVELALNHLNTKTTNAMLAKVKKLAASVGANGVVVNLFVPGDGVRKLLTFMGTAIYVSPSAEKTGSKQ